MIIKWKKPEVQYIKWLYTGCLEVTTDWINKGNSASASTVLLCDYIQQLIFTNSFFMGSDFWNTLVYRVRQIKLTVFNYKAYRCFFAKNICTSTNVFIMSWPLDNFSISSVLMFYLIFGIAFPGRQQFRASNLVVDKLRLKQLIWNWYYCIISCFLLLLINKTFLVI